MYTLEDSKAYEGCNPAFKFQKLEEEKILWKKAKTENKEDKKETVK